jgi:hypothetical protein
MTDDTKPMISPEEMQRRRKHVSVAIADSRIEGIATSDAEQEVFDAYIRGEIEARDLVTTYQRLTRERARRNRPCPRCCVGSRQVKKISSAGRPLPTTSPCWTKSAQRPSRMARPRSGWPQREAQC